MVDIDYAKAAELLIRKVDDLRTQLASKDTQIRILEACRDAFRAASDVDDASIKDLKAQLAASHAELSDIDRLVGGKPEHDCVLDSVKSQFAAWEETETDLNCTIGFLQTGIGQYKSKLSAKDAQISAMHKAEATQDSVIQGLREQVNSLHGVITGIYLHEEKLMNKGIGFDAHVHCAARKALANPIEQVSGWIKITPETMPEIGQRVILIDRGHRKWVTWTPNNQLCKDAELYFPVPALPETEDKK